MHLDHDQNTNNPRESAEKATLAMSEGIAACGTAGPQGGAPPRHPECFRARQPGGRLHCTPRRKVSRGTWAGWNAAAQRGVACTCDESHRSAAAGRRHCRSWRIDHRAGHRRHFGRGIQRPVLLGPDRPPPGKFRSGKRAKPSRCQAALMRVGAERAKHLPLDLVGFYYLILTVSCYRQTALCARRGGSGRWRRCVHSCRCSSQRPAGHRKSITEIDDSGAQAHRRQSLSELGSSEDGGCDQ
jgi:hypothetical protein